MWCLGASVGGNEGSFCRRAAGARQAVCICLVLEQSPRESVRDEGDMCVWGLVVGHSDDQLVLRAVGGRQGQSRGTMPSDPSALSVEHAEGGLA